MTKYSDEAAPLSQRFKDDVSCREEFHTKQLAGLLMTCGYPNGIEVTDDSGKFARLMTQDRLGLKIAIDITFDLAFPDVAGDRSDKIYIKAALAESLDKEWDGSFSLDWFVDEHPLTVPYKLVSDGTTIEVAEKDGPYVIGKLVEYFSNDSFGD